ncbi:SusC/RagA family TonB-linked outer membrane protein [Fulvivirga maritima]|uniref:SusC/RagA family TonB-linked outer membrane protein n=1 Tax=Fulvivirga maritima TaxID=2904247 RepID=UPI001F1B9F36|nr:SusC/RagA family TonB-linked outer membrane protein [Fulvivirga maritima]UII28193.1 SusC/RagA family TonB-linked outer membrane protein [Fulvivirga maritima]
MKKVLLLIFLLLPVLAFSQNKRVITGRVFSEADNMALPGASVYIASQSISNETGVDGIIESTSVGTVTDADGNFSLQVPKNVSHVIISFIGFESQTLELGTTDHYEIQLKEEISSLSGVVITGYQTVEKRKLTSSIANVGIEENQQIGVASVDQLLVGQAPGVVVTPQTGAPGTPAKIRIRGTASLNGPQDPLWVVDGMPLQGNDIPDFSDKDNIDQLANYSIAGISPEDIEDITILKDAAATAIYGARAANGVIVVTTKSGKKGAMKVNFSANAFYNFRPDFDKLNLMNSNQKVDFELGLASRTDLNYRTDKGEVMRILNNSGELDAYRNGGFSSLSQQTQAQINRLRTQSTDWGDELYQSAINQQYNLSFSGGGDVADYYVSVGYYDEDGTTIGTGLERYNLTVKNNFNLSDKWKAGITFLGSSTDKKSYVTGTGVFSNPAYYARTANAYLNPYDEDGNYNYDQDIEGEGDQQVPFSFLEERENTSYELNNRAIKSIFDLSYDIFTDLTISTQLGLQLDHSSTEKFATGDTYFTRKFRERSRRWDSSIGDYYYFLPEGGIIQNWEEDFFQYNWKSQLQYNTFIGDKHEVDALIGSELRRSDSKLINTQGFGYDENALTTTPIIFPNESDANEGIYRTYNRSTAENAYTSFYGTASYTYDRKYVFFGSLRYDGSNLFGVDPKYKYLPLWSISGSWVASEENFLAENPVISNLRLRASYGIQGNIDRNTSPYVVGTYSAGSILPRNTEQQVQVSSPPNDKLRWEKTKNYNVGIDLGIVNNRINVIFDAYQRISSDLIGLKSLPVETGFYNTSLNWAEVTNKGWELAISSLNVKTTNFKWSTDFNISHNKSEVNDIQVREDSRLPSREGLPVNAVFVLKTAGIDDNGYPTFIKDGEEISTVEFFKLSDPWADFFPGEFVESNLGTEEFRDLFAYAGDRDPKYSGGITNRFTYKNVSLAVTASFNLKQTVVKDSPYNPAQVDRGRNYTTDILDAWSEDNPNSQLPGIVSPTSGEGDAWMAYKWFNSIDDLNTLSYLDSNVKEMSYVRITSMRLGYSLPGSLTSKLKISGARINLEGRNLLVFGSDYSGYFDPETYGSLYAQPIQRSVSLGLNVSF